MPLFKVAKSGPIFLETGRSVEGDEAFSVPENTPYYEGLLNDGSLISADPEPVQEEPKIEVQTPSPEKEKVGE